ncbi:hypothetical protein [Phytohabitans kaempferiae]|uniref:HTH cro/C1-type domain-containing protein n=1 Tax=Phytohabitans kaempferiae TaxID=1620943 RepID=A0ABV6M9H0_9ACTN
MQQAAARQGFTLPKPASLKSMISRWEQGQHLPDRQNRKVLAAALGIDESILDVERETLPSAAPPVTAIAGYHRGADDSRAVSGPSGST